MVLYLYMKKNHLKKKKNQSLIYQVILENSNANFSNKFVHISMNIWSLEWFIKNNQSFNCNISYRDLVNIFKFGNNNKSIAYNDNTDSSKINNNKSITYNDNVKEKSLEINNSWDCSICTFTNTVNMGSCAMCMNANVNDSESQQNDEIKQDNEINKKKSIIGYESTQNIDDLITSDEDDDMIQPNGKKRPFAAPIDHNIRDDEPSTKCRKINTNNAFKNDIDSSTNTKSSSSNNNIKSQSTKFGNGTINTFNTNDTNINTNIKLYANPNNDPIVTLNNMAIQHKWLVQQTHCMTVIEDVRLLWCKFAMIRDLHSTLGCKPIAILSGIGSKTSAKNWQKNYIAMKRCNEKRKGNNLPEMEMPINNQRLLINKYFEDSFDKTASEMRSMIKSPGNEWPLKTDSFVEEKDKTTLTKLIEQRYNIFITFKKLQKIHNVKK
eukprot:138446_1